MVSITRKALAAAAANFRATEILFKAPTKAANLGDLAASRVSWELVNSSCPLVIPNKLITYGSLIFSEVRKIGVVRNWLPRTTPKKGLAMEKEH